ncbi:helix-turn-helix domain-containing protein [Aurantimonas sp. A3-2-R12]|uniref:helix-turn-helix domain-containing protein n=1 Tax=Aurantimonas sp. A3-2-R12 TaxID=3114362 RepID=UPI002E195198|nr:helix-turn-helix transcriptional regulator [Aurantimonas sp. A3-2-R12]
MTTLAKAANPEDISIGEKLRACRAFKGMSQADLGNAIGVSFQQVQKYEKGTNRISGSRLRKAAKALGVQVVELIGEDETADPISFYPADVMKLARRLSGLPAGMREPAVASLHKVVDAIESAAAGKEPDRA